MEALREAPGAFPEYLIKKSEGGLIDRVAPVSPHGVRARPHTRTRNAPALAHILGTVWPKLLDFHGTNSPA